MSSAEAGRRRFLRPSIFINPATGERVKRVFTLRDASSSNRAAPSSNEEEPLLGSRSSARQRSSSTSQRWIQQTKKHAHDALAFATSTTGQSIFKCALAYLLGSLATFIPAIANAIGRGDSKHMVATVTVWFHPARTIGSMSEGAFLALMGFCYAVAVSFTSMGTSVLFATHGLLQLGHMIILIVFCGGGLGFIAWTKQYFGHPLVNVACSLASLACITTLVKEGSIQDGAFSAQSMTQILIMVLTGIILTTLVNSIVLPVTAKSRLHTDITKSTDLQGDILVNITRAFLSGEEAILQEGKSLVKSNNACLGSMNKNLVEAQKEYLLLGHEEQYRIERQIVKCLARLSQDLGGLRSAASTQFSILGGRFGGDIDVSVFRSNSLPGSPPPTMRKLQPGTGSVSRSTMLDVITEDPEELEATPQSIASMWFDSRSPSQNGHPTPTSPQQSQHVIPEQDISSPADMFVAFISRLGPPAKALAYTLKQILDVEPFAADGTVNINEQFHPSLESAIELYKQSRREALEALYRSRALNNQRKTSILADLEEVAASCGHFSFSLLDFAEDCLAYLELLEDLKVELEQKPRKRTWHWLMVWRRGKQEDNHPVHDWHGDDDFTDPQVTVPASLKKIDHFADSKRYAAERPWTYRLYQALYVLRRDDIRFAIKVGVGAALYALPAFLPQSRPFFHQYRGEWGLVSYMVVCSMTIGASNTTGIQRFLGTCIGAALAILAWLISNDGGDANPYLLAFLGWLVALGCFYLILAKNMGPMGRFILLTYNLGALYAYSLSIQDEDDDDDELVGGIDPAIWDIVMHRVVAVIAGCIWGIVITRFIWPISARRKFQNGLCVLWLRMGLIWKRDPLAMFLLGEPKSHYMDIREEAELQAFLSYLDSLRQAAKSEFELRGPFPDKVFGRIVDRTRQMLESFHAMNVVILKQNECTPGEAAVLRQTREERFALSARISHLFSVLASSLKLEYPLNDVLPNIEDRRDKLLTKLFEHRRSNGLANEADYELFYAYMLVTGQLAQDIEAVIRDIETLFGTLDEENLKLQ